MATSEVPTWILVGRRYTRRVALLRGSLQFWKAAYFDVVQERAFEVWLTSFWGEQQDLHTGDETPVKIEHTQEPMQLVLSLVKVCDGAYLFLGRSKAFNWDRVTSDPGKSMKHIDGLITTYWGPLCIRDVLLSSWQWGCHRGTQNNLKGCGWP